MELSARLSCAILSIRIKWEGLNAVEQCIITKSEMEERYLW